MNSDSITSTHNTSKSSQQKPVSFFEFWPTWVMYAPVAIQWMLLALRYRSLTLPLIANPKLTVSGMVGVPKSELMEQAVGQCHRTILDWNTHTVTPNSNQLQVTQWLDILQHQKITFPFVCKPDIGCRGSGVKLVHNREQLHQVMAVYPVGSTLMAQALASWEPEAGIFFVKKPGEAEGEVVSLTLKHNPSVIGDGISTLSELVQKDDRARILESIYKERHLHNWDCILSEGESYKLVFSASHCQGAIFNDAREHITPELTKKINQIMKGLPEFYYGRMDVKFSNLKELKQGINLEIIEINGASAESIHIWDKNATLSSAVKTLLWQYKTLFQIGALNRKRGFKPPGVKNILSLWRKEKNLVKHYPLTD